VYLVRNNQSIDYESFRVGSRKSVVSRTGVNCKLDKEERGAMVFLSFVQFDKISGQSVWDSGEALGAHRTRKVDR
jgi:hypothetical protein